MNRMTFGELLRRHRLWAGLTQQQLAARSALGVRTVRDLELDRVDRPRALTVQQLADALGLSTTERARLRATAGLSDAGDRASLVVSVGVLGSLQVTSGDAPVHVAGAGPRCLLGLLALQAGKTITQDEIVNVLWNGTPPKAYLNQIQVYVGGLRRLLEPPRPAHAGFQVLVRSAGGYQLNTETIRTDVAVFDHLLARAGAADMQAQPQSLLLQALQCWRGPILGGADSRLTHHPAAVALAGRRVDMALECAEMASGSRAALSLLRTVAADEPLHERLQARLMVALAADGQRAAALGVFHRVSIRLRDELGITPGADLLAARRRVLSVQRMK